MRHFKGNVRRSVVTTTQSETKATQSWTKTTQSETKSAQPETKTAQPDVIGRHSRFAMPTEETNGTQFLIATTQSSNRRETSCP
jgi:hypothetical protein